MVNGLYTASRGMMNILAKQDLMANNLANASTTGFKISQLATRSDVKIDRNDEFQLHQDEKQTLNEEYTQFTQGSFLQTEHSFDAAIAGPGFFNVQTPEGTAYTRNGSFTLNLDKQLVTLNGRRVLDDLGQPIRIDGRSVAIQTDGGIFVDGEQVGKMGISEFQDKRQLIGKGDGLYRNLDPVKNPPQPSSTSELKQGFLESSNVDTVGAMVAMIALHRNYEADQKVVTSIDQTLNKAVNDVGRV